MSTGEKYILVNNGILKNFFQRNIVEYCVLVFKFNPSRLRFETRLNLTGEILFPEKPNKTAAKSRSRDLYPLLYSLFKPNQNINPDRLRKPLIYPLEKSLKSFDQFSGKVTKCAIKQ